MRTIALLLLVALPAWAADDAPKRASRVAPGYVVTEAGWFFTDEGKRRVDERLQGDAQKLAQTEADKKACEEVPALTWKGAAALMGVGAGVAIIIVGAIMVAAKH